MTVLRSILLFTLAAAAEIGGAWLVWQGVRAALCLAGVAVIMYAPGPAGSRPMWARQGGAW